MASQRRHFFADTNGLWLFVDADWQTLTATPPDTALGDGWLDQVDSEDRERVAAAWQKTVRGREPLNLTYTLRNGTHISHQASPTPQGFVGSLDLGSEYDSRNQAADLLPILAALPAAIYQYLVNEDGSGQFTYLNPQSELIYELPVEQCLIDFQLAWNLIHPDDREAVASSMTAAIDNYTAWAADYRLLMPDGRIKWLSGRSTPLRNPQGQATWNGVFIDITEQKLTELALAESQTRLLGLTQNLPGVVLQYCWHPDGRDSIVYISEGCERLWGLTPAEIGNQTERLWQAAHPDDREGIRHSLAQSATNLVPWQHSWRITTTSGQLRWVEASGMPRRLADGAVIWDAVILDITKRKLAELALQAAQQHFQTLAENSPDIIKRFDRDLRHLYVSPAIERFFGVNNRDFIGKTCRELALYDSILDAFEAAATQAQTTAEPQRIEFETDTNQGRRSYEMIIVPELIANSETGFPETHSLLCISRDITRYREALQALQASEQRLTTLISNLPGFVYTFLHTPNYPATYLSDGVEEITGYSADHFMGQSVHFGEIMHPDDREFVWQVINRAIDARLPYEFEYRLTTATGEERWVWERGQGIFDDRDQLLHTEGFITDITARKQAELALQAKIQREQALNRVTQAIRDSLNLPTIFATATRDIAALFQLYAAMVARYDAERAEWCVICDHCCDPGAERFPNYVIPDRDNPFAARLKRGERVIASTDHITDTVNQVVAQTFPGTWLLLPLMVEGQTWGSLSLHITDPAYHWHADQIDLVQMLANQLAIAIQQAQLTQQLQSVNERLQQQVAVRTQELQKALEFEALTRRITNQISISLDETEILATVVEAIGRSLTPLLCNISTYSNFAPTVRHTYRHGLFRGGDLVLPIEQHLDIYSNLYRGQITQATTHVASLNKHVTLLVVPICQEGNTIGDIVILRPAPEHFSPAEVDLVTQVSDQCTIALRQSRLYQAAQGQVSELQRLNRLKDDFLSTISHELRTPMTSIKLATQMLSHHLGNVSDLPEFLWRYLDVLKNESDREITLINDLLEMARLEAGATHVILSPIQFGSLIQRLVTPLSLRIQEQQQTFQMLIPDDLPVIYSDITYLERILGELLFNASKYTPAHGQISIRADLKADWLAIEVTNTGVSIPESEWESIFKKFYRLTNNDPWKHGGTGLGLALVQQCVATLGGRIAVSSTASSTTFSVELPAILTAATDARQ